MRIATQMFCGMDRGSYLPHLKTTYYVANSTLWLENTQPGQPLSSAVKYYYKLATSTTKVDSLCSDGQQGQAITMLHMDDRNSDDTKRKRSKVAHHPVTAAPNNARIQPSSPPTHVDPCNRQHDDANSDGGHRFGNFHEYYKFHPVDHRMSLLEPLLRHITMNYSIAAAPSLDKPEEESKNDSSVPITHFRYLDVGCNEGDLTLAVAERLKTLMCHASAKKPMANVHVRGMDLDPLLIDRARAKVNGWEHSSSIVNRYSGISFETVNVLQDGIPQGNAVDEDGYVADLTSLFSTTMWLHIHGGDDGLRRVLKQICHCTRHWILLEVQPSKCYGKAALRWRKKMGGQPPLDVSPKRLQLRAKIDDAVEEMLQQHGFERVRIAIDEHSEESGRKIPAEGRDRGMVTADQSKEIEVKTPWNRSCRLYTRVESLNKARQ